jgi:hypothetical protein
LTPALEHFDPGVTTALALGSALASKTPANKAEAPMRFINSSVRS